MTYPGYLIALATLFILFVTAITTARADQIDGNWCSDKGEILMINGSSVVTPGGNRVTANYDRHHVDYEIPAAEKHAGNVFSADQLNDEQVRVKVRKWTGDNIRPAEIWRKCKPIS